jgi:hypothetical protein
MGNVSWVEMGSWVGTLALAFGLAAVAGIRAWLPLLLTGLLARFGLVHVGHSFEFVSTTPALVLFGIATIVEIAGDKIPAIDHTLDVAGTFIRPAAGALLAASAMYQIESPLYACVLGLVIGAPTALVPHATKAAARAASSTFTMGLANPLLSFAEDGVALAMFALAILLPVLLAVAFAVGFGVALYVIRTRARKAPKAALPPVAEAA